MLNEFSKKEAPIQGLTGLGGGVPSRLFGTVTPPDNWIVTLGGSSSDQGNGVGVSTSGDIYVCGYTQSEGAGSSDAFIAKYDTNGTIQWQRILGDSNSDIFVELGLDSNDNVYVGGYSLSPNSGVDSYDSIHAKYNSSGTIQWQRKLSGGSAEFTTGTAVDSSGNMYFNGQSSSGGYGYDYLIAKYNSSGTIQWQRTLGDGNDNRGRGVDVDDSGNVYVAGYNNFSGNTSLVAKYNSSGSLQWQRNLEGGGTENIAVTNSGDVYAVGKDNGGGPDMRVVKYNTSGNIQWQRSVGSGSGNSIGYSVALDSSENVYAVGETTQAGAGNKDILIVKYNSSGTIQWQRTLGGTSSDEGKGIIHDGNGNIIIVGETESSGAGGRDVLIAKLPDDGSLTGTYGSYTYASSSLTEDATSNTDNPGSLTSNTSSYTDDSISFTSATSTLTSTRTSL